jgi:hypothetical protein
VQPTVGESIATARVPLKLPIHVIIGIAITVVSFFTGLAWPFAILTGIVIGKSRVDRAAGIRVPFAGQVVRILAVTGGVFAMMVAGALIGGLIAFVIVAFAELSEQLAARASAEERTLSRIVLFVVPIAAWIVFLFVLGGHVDIRFGT